MVNDLLGWLDYSAFAEAALLLFLVAFGAVCIAMARVSSRWSDDCAAIPLTGDESKVNVTAGDEAMFPMEQT